jgi:hypothetical protein
MLMKLSDDAALVEEIAMSIYCDSYTQYGTCNQHHWKRTSETQREFCRGQARVALDRTEAKLIAKGWKPP